MTAPTPKTALRGYAWIISEATGIVDPEALAAIEDCMRHDIFHSTLDWQSRSLLRKAARIAAAALGYDRPRPALGASRPG